MNSYVIYLAPALGILGLIVMAMKSAWVSKQDAGDAKMQELAGHIADGAMAFLKAEWRVLSIFVVITAALLAYSGTVHSVNGREIHSSWVICIAFIMGAVFSATAGFIGMRVATKANVRTTQAARTSLKQALKVSFTGGTVMGLGVAGLAVLGLGGLFIDFLAYFANVGDVAGMGADLFGSYVATILATMVLGQEIKITDAFGGLSPILLPMVICGLGIVFSIAGMAMVRIKDESSSVQ